MKTITVIIETPRNTQGKYVFDPVNQCYKLKKILPLGMAFPYDVGMIENTHAEDGDPADAMVITECITYPGELKIFPNNTTSSCRISLSII